jgi:hypothetical protein
MSEDLTIGDRVRVIAPAASVFRGYEGVVAHFSKRGRKRRMEYAIRLLDHPWQVKSPEARYFFSADELERVGEEMKAGREMDALVAEKGLGLHVVWSKEPYIVPGRPRKEGRFPYLKGTATQGMAQGVEYDWVDVAHYSTDISAAWQVWHAVKALDRHKAACFWSALRSLVQMRLNSEHLINDAQAALYMEPEDICKAMLEAHGMRMLPDWYYE